jgi:hypothetical protein
MFASTPDTSYHSPATKGASVASWFLRRLNMGALAFAMFVALALLSNTQGTNAGPGRLSAARAAKSEIAIHPQMTGKITVR